MVQRVLFHPGNFGVAPNGAALKYKASLPLRAFTSIERLHNDVKATTLNVGNIVHNEAVAKCFEVKRAKSCMSGIEHVFYKECKGSVERYQALLRDNFDAVIFSFANMIAPPPPGRAEAQQEHMERLCEIVDKMPIPLYVFGMGMQEPVEDETTLVPAMVEFLKLLDKKARLVGVRGAETEAFLHRIGCGNAVALGCPSLYVYPENILSIKPGNVGPDARVLTAGYMGLRHLFGFQDARVDFLRSLAGRYRTSYVFQNDIYSYHELKDIKGLYDDATGQCDQRVLNDYVRAHGAVPPAFDGSWHFRDARAWRQFAAEHDFYFGDRFHGGVVALQASRPSLFVYNDLRVRELTEHYRIPNCALDEIMNEDLESLVQERLSRERLEEFKACYASRLREYYERCRDAGLTPIDNIGVSALSRQSPTPDWVQDIVATARAHIADTAQTEDRSAKPKLLAFLHRDAQEPVAATVTPGERISAAVAIFEKAGGAAAPFELIIRGLIAADQLDAAAQCLHRFLGAPKEIWMAPDPDFYFRLANLFHGKKRHEEARSAAVVYFREMGNRKPRNVRLFASILQALGKTEKAQRILFKLRERDGTSPAIELQLAQLALEKGELDAAERHAEEGLSLAPEPAVRAKLENTKKRVGEQQEAA
ncbi:polysaccharide pyruvyl transferase family protein [Kordiimonas sp.]|uniref:polysaccharide pyruvyl transferase family protein n=1 Tax=Kordiimonas sp. TaxID=1970157 RepID=UPI003A8EE083